MDKIAEYPVVEIEVDPGLAEQFYYVFTHKPTIWSDDGKQVLALYGSPGKNDAYHLISVADGKKTYLGELPGQHLGLIDFQEE